MFDNGDTIDEIYVGTYNMDDAYELDLQRVTFNIIEPYYDGRQYVFICVYQLDLRLDCKSKTNTWQRVRDTYDFTSCKY